MNDRRYVPSLRSTLRAWSKFNGLVQARLKQGAREYRNRSFSKDPLELLHELQQEALDLAGWSFILFVRLKKAEQALRNTKPPKEPFFPDFGED